MRIKALILVASAVAIGGFAAGCGSSNDNSTSTSSLSKAEWIAKADAICKAGNQEINAAAHQTFSKGAKPTQQQVQQFFQGTVIPKTQDQVSRIKALGLPSEQASQANAVLSSAQSTLDRVKADPSLLAGKGDPFAQTNQLGKAYGLKVCGKGGG
jgi:ABC-type taurine transport system substrate-binding protein